MSEAARFYVESDGGDTHDRKAPRTFYVVDREGLLPRLDCRSNAEAEKVVKILSLDWIAAMSALYDEVDSRIIVRDFVHHARAVVEDVDAIELQLRPERNQVLSHLFGFEIALHLYIDHIINQIPEAKHCRQDIMAAYIDVNILHPERRFEEPTEGGSDAEHGD